MLQRMIDDVRAGMGNSLRLTSLAAAAAVTLLIATGFFCAALFVFVQQREGTVAACMAGGAVFLVIALIAVGSYMLRKRQDRIRLELAAREAKSTASALFADPAMLGIGLQIVRLIGVRRLIPLLAIGGVVLGVLASQRDRREAPAE